MAHRYLKLLNNLVLNIAQSLHSVILVLTWILISTNGIERNQTNVRSSINLSGCGVQDSSGTSQHAHGGQNSRILLNRGSRGTCSQLTRGKQGGCRAINKENRGGRTTTRSGRGTTRGGRGTTRGGRGTTRGGRITITGTNTTPAKGIPAASEVNNAAAKDYEVFTLNNDNNNEDLLFRDLEVEQEGMFIYYGLTFVCNI